MKEKSHLDDMREAIRGDRERAAARAKAQKKTTTKTPAARSKQPKSEPVAAAVKPVAEPPRKGLFSRLFGRR